MSKIRFSIEETLEALHEDIVKVLPKIKAEWEKVEEGKKVFFTTIIGRVKIEVHETFANFTLTYSNAKEESRKYEKIKTIGEVKRPIKLNIYSTIKKRFEIDEEFSFYKRVSRSLNGQLNVQKEKHEVTFTENANRSETDSDNE